MPAQTPVKTAGSSPRLVGVITSRAELRVAARMASPPDLFELRLDCLVNQDGLERAIRALRSPVIITARHPAEGGKHQLSPAIRRELLLRFLPLAQYVDIELRSVHTSGAVLERARRIGLSTIISFHDLASTPSLGSLRAKAERARRLRPALFKVVSRTDTVVQLARLLQFVFSSPHRLAICAMGIGRLGAISRLVMAQSGSAFVYTSLSRPQLEGQLQLHRLRTILREIGFYR